MGRTTNTYTSPIRAVPGTTASSIPQSVSSKTHIRIYWIALGIALIALVVLALHVWKFRLYLADDALISLRYSKRLLEGHGLTWNNGERIEGYSNLLWVLLCAGLGALGIDLITAARLLGMLGAAGAVCAVAYAYGTKKLTDAPPALIGAFAIALSGSLAAWVMGGLEEPLVAGLLAWALVLCLPLLQRHEPLVSSLHYGQVLHYKTPLRKILLPGLFLGLLCITRPDGAIFTATAFIGVFIALGMNSRSFVIALKLAALPVAFWLGQLGFRRLYYHAWVPNTALAKVSFSLHHLVSGWEYFQGGIIRLLPLLLFIGVILFMRDPRDKPYRRRIYFFLLPLVAWSLYIIAIGGDWFLARRHMVPIAILLSLIAAEAMRWLIRRHIKSSVGFAFTVVALLLFGFLQLTDTRNIRASEERWAWDGEPVGLLLKTAFGQQHPLIAVDAAGTVPYFSDLPSLDMLGLNDYYLPRHPPPGFGQGLVGHELGDGNYLLHRDPDLVLFDRPIGKPKAIHTGGVQMQADPRFQERYTLVTFHAVTPYPFDTHIWVRRESRSIGIHRSDDSIIVPGFLLNGNPKSAAMLDDAGKLYVATTTDMHAQINTLMLPPGRWRAEVIASDPNVRIKVTDTEKIQSAGSPSIAFTLSVPSTVDLEVEPTKGTAVNVYKLILSREGDEDEK